MAARSTLSSLITRLRDMTAAGTADYTVGATAYWSDTQLQAVLDRNRLDVVDETLRAVPALGAGGTAEYFLYQSQHGNFETTDGGTAIFYLAHADGTRVGTADYTVDYDAGRITFSANTLGSAFYLTGRTYDLNSAAAEVWTMKADHVADRFDFTADGASFKVSQLQGQYMARADRYRKLSSFGSGAGVRVVNMERTDMVGSWDNY